MSRVDDFNLNHTVLLPRVSEDGFSVPEGITMNLGLMIT